MNDYDELFELIIKSFILNGFEIYQKSSTFCSLNKWLLVHRTEDFKVLESQVYIGFDNAQHPTEIIVRFNDDEKE